jgi:hypothetical protein
MAKGNCLGIQDACRTTGRARPHETCLKVRNTFKGTQGGLICEPRLVIVGRVVSRLARRHSLPRLRQGCERRGGFFFGLGGGRAEP